MRLLTLLPSSMRTAVDNALRSRPHSAHHSRSIVELFRALESDPWSTVVVDPAVLTDEGFVDLRRALADLRVGLLLWGSLSPACERFLVASDRGVVDVLFFDREFDLTLLVVKLDSMQERTACGSLLGMLAPRMHPMPRAIRTRLIKLFGSLPVPASARYVAKSIGMPRRTLDRWVIRSGFISTAVLLKTIRLAWAWDLSRAERADLPDYALSRCGYSSPHRFWDHAHGVLAIAPSALRVTPPTDAAIRLLVDSVTK